VQGGPHGPGGGVDRARPAGLAGDTPGDAARGVGPGGYVGAGEGGGAGAATMGMPPPLRGSFGQRHPPPPLRNSSILQPTTVNPQASSWRPTRGGTAGMTMVVPPPTELAQNDRVSSSLSPRGSGTRASTTLRP